MKWKYFYSSVKGTSHISSNTPKQDNCSCLNVVINEKDYLISVVADGAGSAKFSDKSSGFICRLFTRKIKKWIENNSLENLTREEISNWFKYFQVILERAVIRFKLNSSRDFATTLLFSVLSDDCNIFVQIGDGIIATGGENVFENVFQPQNGEFINTTSFATQANAADIFMFKTTNNPVKKIAMHTDGIEHIAFDFKSEKPFYPFFRIFFKAISKIETCGFCEKLSKELEHFLQSPKVNARTDDDKTLLLAVVNDYIEPNEVILTPVSVETVAPTAVNDIQNNTQTPEKSEESIIEFSASNIEQNSTEENSQTADIDTKNENNTSENMEN